MAELRITGACEPLELAAPPDGMEKMPPEMVPPGGMEKMPQKGKRMRRFSMVAYTGVPMRLEGFFRPVVVDLAGLDVPVQAMPVLRDHDPMMIVAHTDAVEVTAQRCKVSGVMSGVGTCAVEVMETASNGFPWQASIGASADSKEFVEAGSSVKVNGRNYDGPLVVVRKSTLKEISFVPLGADPGTSARVAASIGGSGMDFSAWLAAKGFEPDKLTDAQRKPLEAAYRLETAPPPPPAPEKGKEKEQNDSFDDKMAAIEAENARIVHIQGATERAATANIRNTEKVQQLRTLCEAAIADKKMDARGFDLALLRLDRSAGPTVFAPRAQQVTGDVLEAAFARRVGLKNREQQYDPQTLEASDRLFKRGIGLQELLGHFARLGGWRGMSLSSAVESKSFYQAAFSDDANEHDVRAGMAGPSTYSLPNILANVANKGLKSAFESVDQAWRQVADIKPVSDFKQISTVSLVGDLMYREVPRGGELKHGSVQERAYVNQASTYGILLGIDRRDIINDDAGAIGTATRHVGRGAGLKLNQLFYTIFNLNTSFFSAGNNNVITGGTSVLSGATGLEALRLAYLKFMQQTDPTGQPLGIRPAILFVPTELEVAARNLINSTEVLGTTTANSLMPTANAFANTLRVVSTPYLSNTSYSGSSTTAWYLLAEPSEMAVMQAVFVNGVDTPTVETADMDWNTLGMAWRGYIDAGFAFQEFRGGVRAAGA